MKVRRFSGALGRIPFFPCYGVAGALPARLDRQ